MSSAHFSKNYKAGELVITIEDVNVWVKNTPMSQKSSHFVCPKGQILTVIKDTKQAEDKQQSHWYHTMKVQWDGKIFDIIKAQVKRVFPIKRQWTPEEIAEARTKHAEKQTKEAKNV